MKIKTLGLIGLSGLMLGLMAPAEAHDGHKHFKHRYGPAYVYYDDGYRIDRRYRYGPKKRHRHNAAYRRHLRQQHKYWHHCYDGRWYRYNDRRHWRSFHRHRH